MPVNGYTVGRDVVLSLITPQGPLVLNKITGFTSKQETNSLKVKRLDGITDYGEVPDGWSGSMTIERAGPQLEDYFAAQEAGFYAGRNLDVCSLTETITEPGGAVTQYRFEGMVLKLDDNGSKEGDKTVTQKVGWNASRRKKVA